MTPAPALPRPSGPSSWLAGAFAAALLAFAPPAHAAPRGPLAAEAVVAAVPTPQLAAALFALPPDAAPVALTREDAPVPLWRAEAGGAALGVIGSTWELAGSTGYSGRPVDVLVALSPEGVVAGAALMAQQEPVLTLGISQDDIAGYVAAFRGYDAAAPVAADTLAAGAGLPDVISRATISTGVIRDGIIRSARILATAARPAQGGIDRVGFRPLDWQGLVEMGGLVHAEASMTDAARAFAGAKQVPQASDQPFVSLWTGLADPPMVGRNLLGQRAYTGAIAAAAPDEVLLAVLSSGVQGHRGTDWKSAGRFERITVRQGDLTLIPATEGYTPIDRLDAAGAPEFRERSLFRLPADPAKGGIDPLQPFTVTVSGTRPAAAAAGDALTLGVTAEVRLPDSLRLAAPPPAATSGTTPSADPAAIAAPDMPPPLWEEFWRIKRPQVAIVGAMLAVLGLILFGQEWLVARKRLWRRVRLAYLATTLVVLGWGIGGQLSIVQLIAFVQALLTGFRWETFLIAPVIFVLWSAVALGMLFWGRGVFCGWLCPFGALQELTNAAAQRLGVRQIAVPQALHERLWVIKYSLFVGLVALSFYSLPLTLKLAEVEPFKTAISMRFMRAWPFVLYVVALLTAGLFIERFFCRYLCPLGAGLALPAKLKVFDWLRRRPQCGRECRLCETKCTVGAIDPLGRINANECVLCLRCQVIMTDHDTCPVLKRRARGQPGGGGGDLAPTALRPMRPAQVPAGAYEGAAAPATAPAQPPAFLSQRVTP